MSVWNRLVTWGRLVKFSHSIFALPFALMMIVLVAEAREVTVVQIALLILCVVAARTAAMACNRLVDVDIDAKNPRTKMRELPAGLVSKGSTIALIVIASVAFVGASAGLGVHCAVLAPPALVVLFGYSLMKRYSALCHLVLGVALSLAPGGVWYALTGEWSWKPVPLMATVVLWVAGFDILYSCQDADFDNRQGLFSVPSRFGVQRALSLACVLHLGSLGALIGNGVVFECGISYWIGVGGFALLLLNQHRQVARHGIECIDHVFFTRNGSASVLLFLSVLADAILRGH